MKKVFYNASLPRSGSTLLQNVLAQNPSLYVTPTSGLYELLLACKDAYTRSIEFSAQDVDTMEKAFGGFCRGAIDGFCNGLSHDKYVIDKNFSWPVQFNLLEKIYGEKPKMIIMVRDLREIFASMEQGHRNNVFRTNTNVNWDTLQNTTMKKRVEEWASSSPLGSSLDMIKELINWKNENDVFFVKYEHFCAYPQPIMDSLYNYLGIDSYKHDFNNVEQATYQNDHFYTFRHKIRSKVEPIPSKSLDILGQSLCDSICQEYDWYFKYFHYAI